MKHIVIVGATSAMAHECARIWAEQEATHFSLVGRSAERLQRVADDLKARSPGSDVTILATDFLSPEAIQATVDETTSNRRIDIALIAHGSLPDQNNCQIDLNVCADSLAVNGLSPALFAEALAGKMEDVNYGSLAIIGSVAGDRGRKSNYSYGAAKGLVERYTQGLQHRFAGTGVTVTLIKPGPTATPMTKEMQLEGTNLAKPVDVATAIVGAIHKNRLTIYAPEKWRIIMLVIKHMPSFIFNKLNI
ncbi:SDR family NAD(P)-dependent oxidoreductase [Marinobacter sp. TBZ242]|uniref:SDR family NAD(P)-dependent oxidoreductase n=1 Tax=Marinobacter azerbaijanicus TaxID=3050455 RepID=A0ABT7I7R3_9GAMM|nr:SDR family NAD(P)-dependent oxidoreductase [Marinobacter sp. TBZ242]MDL0429718.1 SDR family NAD(P)-dependent oxidoreductase [Marinobacter sp. TBZ242]